MLKIYCEDRSGNILCDIDIDNKETLESFKKKFFKLLSFYPERQKWTNKEGKVLVNGSLLQQGIKDKSTVVFKDLGIQISWRLVFVLEYLGPIIIFLFLRLQRDLESLSTTQNVAFWLLILHFIKREFETLFVHRFSHQTMPVYRLPINCFHYWVLCAAFIGHFLFHRNYLNWWENNNLVIVILSVLFIIFEIMNLQTHIVLRNLRNRNSKSRGVPYGWGFDYVSCANYFWEIMVWLIYAILTGCFTSWIFVICSFTQMLLWAKKKHSRYHNEFPNYPKSRKCFIPFVI